MEERGGAVVCSAHGGGPPHNGLDQCSIVTFSIQHLMTTTMQLNYISTACVNSADFLFTFTMYP